MTTFSKFFSARAKNLTCKDIFHPVFDSCLSFHLFFLRKSVIQSLKFLGPIFLVFLRLFLTLVSTLKEWKEKTDTYYRMALGMSGVVVFAFSVHCFLYKIFKEMRYFNITAVPAFISMVTIMSMNFLPANFANLQLLFVNNLLVQTILRTFDNKVLQFIRESKFFSTLLFMMFSSLIMGLSMIGENHRYWYAQNFEINKTRGDSHDTMDEKFDLLKHLVNKQIMSTVKVSLLMSCIKIISNSLRSLRKSLFQFIISFIRNFDYKLLGFFILYGTSFQVFHFLLNEFREKTKQRQNSFLAGFLAGTAFYLSPRYFLFTYAFTTFIELVMALLLKRLNQQSKITKSLQKVSCLKTLFCVSMTMFNHWRIVRPWMIPKFMEQLMQLIALDRLALGSQNYAKYILGI